MRGDDSEATEWERSVESTHEERRERANMNWSYVIAGYTITAATLIGYGSWIRVRTRKLRRTLSDETRD